MSAYIRRIRDFSPDIKRFLFYGLMANIGFGAVELVLNFYILELGYREDGFERAKELAGITSARLVRYERVVSLMRIITGYSQIGKDLPLNLRLAEPKELILPMYLWRPNW